MFEWGVSAAVFVLLLWAMIAWFKRRKTKPSKKGGGSGIILALGMIFASAFDPAKAAATEEIDRQKSTEGSEEGESGAPPA